ncbi:type I DNA topoisomerase [Mesoplasma syrphidae]|uniref:DNA topoisomerase 1 n=1 Tax=Mesoplasma syrphidae TaxID=225999 RepID=A0A2K9BY29_9MOLU|nr:DNA topoisomerase [Mesoplasma syrphidae]AUF83268.1 type I DNA topoisomerase [Mesoplasma syrphidae]
MAKILVLLESPSKVTKIQHFLEEEFSENQYEVLASGGHITKIADTGTWGLGIDLETMTPKFINERTKAKNIAAIKKAGKNADVIVLASDPDREGEAIAWHLGNIFEGTGKIIKRATFNEITKDAVVESFRNLREIDLDLVKAQLSRQMLDKIIGYLVSKSLQKSTGLMSAGRVQTPALNILVTRDKLIKAFKEVIYRKISVINQAENILLTLNKGLDKKVVNTEKTSYISTEQANEIIKSLSTSYQCSEYVAKEFETRSFKPYSTAGLLQDGFSKLRLSAAQITVAAQKLYEAGLITYIRTDSTRYSAQFIKEAKNYIETNFENSLYKDPIIIKTKKDDKSQDAHESIRPTDLFITPEKVTIEDELQKRIYNLIWWNTVKSLMRGPSGLNHRWTFMNNGYEFKQSWQEITDFGYQAIKRSTFDEGIELNEDDEEVAQNTKNPKPKLEFKTGFTKEISKDFIKNDEAKTMPPNMFNQASLIKELKNLGIGRPSTYNPILAKLKEREYAIYHKGKAIEMTDKGYIANNFLYSKFEDFFNLNYTAKMEETLDEISDGDYNYVNWLKDIYTKLNDRVLLETENAKTSDIPCPKCGEGTLVFIKSRFNRGRGCSNFTKTKCGYREYEQPDGTWKEYVTPEKTTETTKNKKPAKK